MTRIYRYQTLRRAIMLVINHNVHAPSAQDILALVTSRSGSGVSASHVNGNCGNNGSWGDPGNDSALFYSGNKCQSIALVRARRLRSSFFRSRSFCRPIRRLNRGGERYELSSFNAIDLPDGLRPKEEKNGSRTRCEICSLIFPLES